MGANRFKFSTFRASDRLWRDATGSEEACSRIHCPLVPAVPNDANDTMQDDDTGLRCVVPSAQMSIR